MVSLIISFCLCKIGRFDGRKPRYQNNDGTEQENESDGGQKPAGQLIRCLNEKDWDEANRNQTQEADSNHAGTGLPDASPEHQQKEKSDQTQCYQSNPFHGAILSWKQPDRPKQFG